MKKYLITGASGFVAFHFMNYLDSLENDTIEVLGIDSIIPNDSENYQFKHIKLRFITLNLLDYSALEIAMTSFSPTYVVHLASFSSVGKSWDEPIDSFINNTNIFLNVVEIIRKNGLICRLLSVGSSEEYGNVQENCIPLKESMPLQPVSPYAIARVSQEMLSKCYVSSYKLDIILTRSFNHIGPRQRDLFVIPSFIKHILENIKNGQHDIVLSTGDVSIIRDFLDVRDVVKAYYLLLEKGISGELYNVCSGIGHTLQEIIDMISSLLKVNVQPVIDLKKIRPNDNKIVIGDNSKTNDKTGWKPVITLTESLQDLITYWKELLGMRL
ncbi:GDP-mannose 4,6-dehydratase [Spirochaetia bacterium]|nr:GDP-mannose 4,6-dehydratase [Spirochaetia bacterium]